MCFFFFVWKKSVNDRFLWLKYGLLVYGYDFIESYGKFYWKKSQIFHTFGKRIKQKQQQQQICIDTIIRWVKWWLSMEEKKSNPRVFSSFVHLLAFWTYSRYPDTTKWTLFILLWVHSVESRHFLLKCTMALPPYDYYSGALDIACTSDILWFLLVYFRNIFFSVSGQFGVFRVLFSHYSRFHG